MDCPTDDDVTAHVPPSPSRGLHGGSRTAWRPRQGRSRESNQRTERDQYPRRCAGAARSCCRLENEQGGGAAKTPRQAPFRHRVDYARRPDRAEIAWGGCFGGVAEWLGEGLQNPLQRFNSAPRLEDIATIGCGLRAISSGGERFLDTEEVRGSNPLPPTTKLRVRAHLARYLL